MFCKMPFLEKVNINLDGTVISRAIYMVCQTKRSINTR